MENSQNWHIWILIEFKQLFHLFLDMVAIFSNIYIVMTTKLQYVVEDSFEYLHDKFCENLWSRIAMTIFAAKEVKIGELMWQILYVDYFSECALFFLPKSRLYFF